MASQVKLDTSEGAITIELDAAKAPESAQNFLSYVRSGHYDGTVFHRVIKGFMIQGGGFEAGMKQKSTLAPIRNEANNGLKNKHYTLAMARTSAPHSATAQFFINAADNGFLDFTSESPQGWGYAVFGKVVAGTEVVDAIERVATGNRAQTAAPVDIFRTTDGWLLCQVVGQPLFERWAKLMDQDGRQPDDPDWLGDPRFASDLARGERLLAENAIARRDLDEKQNAAREAKANLQAAKAAVPRALDPAAAAKAPIHAVTYNEASFRWALNEDAMASDKLAEGIRAFATDAVKLDKMIGAL